MDKSELTSRDIENIGKWEQCFKKLNRKTYTVKEASAFIIGWHPGAYLNDHRKNQIQGLVKLITDSFGYDNWNGGTNTLMDEPSTKFRNEDAFSKEAYYKWANENLPSNAYDIENIEWFKSLRPLKGFFPSSNFIDISTTRFKPLKKGSDVWKKWQARNCYTVEEMAYLIAGVEPIKDGKVEGEIPFFNKQALERFCYNNDYEYPFEDLGDTEKNAESAFEVSPNQHVTTPEIFSSEAITAPTKNENQIELFEGVTVGDIREMVTANQALYDVLQAVNFWRKLPDEGRNLSSSLYSGLNIKAKNNRWGANLDHSLSQKQYDVIGDIFIQSTKKLVGGKEKRLFPKFECKENKK